MKIHYHIFYNFIIFLVVVYVKMENLSKKTLSPNVYHLLMINVITNMENGMNTTNNG